MAKNDKENPDEGTSRSNKDIRKERRQMRAVNRDRKSMGAEPLYSKEEIRDVKKPFEAKPSTVVAGTPVVVDDTPDVEYIQYKPGGYTSKIKPLTKEEFISQKDAQLPEIEKRKIGNSFLYGVDTYDDYLKALGEKNLAPETTTTMQFKAGTPEAQAITELAKGETVEGNAIVQALRKEADKDPNKTFTSSVEENKNINAVKETVNNEINKTNQDVLNTKEQLNTQEKIEEKLPGSGDSVISALRGSENNITWDQTYQSQGIVPEDRNAIFERAAASARKKAPQLAIEKLGVQDYYPEIGRDIAVGTFTGSRIGSQTIYSGAGGVLPLGLYDARKRAIAAEIKRKEALMDELKSVPDIAKQFKPEWTNYVFDKWSNYINAYKDNPDGLSNDLGFAKVNSQLKAIAENFKDVDVYMDDFKEKLMNKDGSAAAWATPRMLEIAKKFNSGFTPEKLEEYFSGKKNIANLKSTVEAIPNGYNHIDKRLKDLLAEPNKVKRAVLPKSGIEWTPELKDKINELSQQVTDGSIDYERYLSVMKEYFDIDFSPMINEWVDASDLGALSEAERKAYKESLQLYAEAQMPAASFIPTFVTANNDSASRYATDVAARTAANRLGWEIEKYNREEKKNPTSVLIDAAMVSPDGSFTQDYNGSKGNIQPNSNLQVKVKNSKGEIKYVNAADLKNNLDSKGNVKVEYYSTLTGKKLTANDYQNIPADIIYQPTQGKVFKSGEDYKYNSTGIGYYGTKVNDGKGGSIVVPKSLDLEFSTYDVPATQGGKKVTATIDVGNVFFGQTPNVQSETIRSSNMTGGSVNP
jgi:hypothetical protein